VVIKLENGACMLIDEETSACMNRRKGALFFAVQNVASGPYATFPDGRRKADISQEPDIAGLLSMLVHEFTPQLDPGSAAHRSSS